MKKIRLFNMDLHVAVIEDFKNIMKKIYGDNMEITNWSLTGNSNFGKPKVDVEVINPESWKQIDKNMIEQFYEKYKNKFDDYDGFVVTHTPIFILLYEKFNKPIIVINSTRYEQPCCWNHNLEMWEYFNIKFKEMYDKKQVTVISNNRADQDYLRMGTGVESYHIPSLCEYTGQKYNPTSNAVLVYSDDTGLVRRNNQIINKHDFAGYGYSFYNLYRCKGFIHVPYEISTMSLFEQYTANMPLIIPTKRLLKELVRDNKIKYYMSYIKIYNRNNKVYPKCLSEALDDDKWVDFFIDRADYYDEDNFKYLIYYDNPNDIEQIVNMTNFDNVSNKMREHNEIRIKKVYYTWKNIIDNIFNF